MYEVTDKVIAYLIKRIVKVFNNANLIKGFDEINIIEYSKEMYEDVNNFVQEAYILLAEDSFKKAIKTIVDDEDTIEELLLKEKFTFKTFVEDILKRYDPVTNYRYDYEIERKRERVVEAIISSKGDEKEFAKALKYLTNMVSQYAVEITRDSYIKGFELLGVKKVQWVTQGDDKVCEKCRELEGNIYDIDKVPPLQHWNCRCELKPVED